MRYDPDGTEDEGEYVVPVIDVHTHLTPQSFVEAIQTRGSWHGLEARVGLLHHEGFNLSIQQRLAEMDDLGVDMQVVAPTPMFYQYGRELAATAEIARDCNDAIGEVVARYPRRFAGFGTLPMQDIPAACAELRRAVRDLGLRGAMVGDHVNGQTYDEPQFLPFFRTAEELGAVVFFHQSGGTCVQQRISRYSLPNAVGNLTERALTFAALVFGGVMDRCPRLRVLLAHGGGYAAFGAGRLDKVAGALEGGDAAAGLQPPFGRGAGGDFVLTRPPSDYLARFHYDCCTFSGPALRFLVDAVGADRVMLGTDYPTPMVLKDAVRWVRGLDCLTADEKDAILSRNGASLLGA
jgi:aminocarboxymuconate-semialdehyde decarboxylase